MSKKIIQALKRNKRFLITTHVNPDPDAICSELALAAYLRSLKKTVAILNEKEVPGRLRFLPGTGRIKSLATCNKLAYDVAVILDCGEFNRIGKVVNFIDGDKPIVNIDHHVTNDSFGSLNLVNHKDSSTCGVLYELLKQAGCKFTKTMAMQLYSGIMTDTGSFRYENTTSKTHRLAAELMKFDFSIPDLYSRFYETIPLKDFKLFTQVINQFEILFGGQAIFVELYEKTVEGFSRDFDLRDAIFKILRSIQGVEVFVIFTEAGKEATRVNLRSRERVNVAQLASFFGGGGHRRASGCLIDAGMKGARKLMTLQVQKVL